MNKENDQRKDQAQVRRALARGDASGLTANDVLQALKNEGISDLEVLANKLLFKMRPSAEETVQKAAMPIDYQLILRPDPTEPDPTIIHRKPAMPFILDGVRYAPEEISRFDGRPLCFVPTGRSFDDQQLIVFKDKIPLMYFVMQQIVASQLGFTDFNPPCEPDYTKPKYCSQAISDPQGHIRIIQVQCGYECKEQTPPSTPPPSRPPAPSLPPAPPSATFFQHMQFAGQSFKMEPGLMYPDLTTLYRPGTSLFEDANWNDVISSIILDRTTAVCCEHVGLQGSKLILGLYQPFDPITMQSYLESIGWNDRISSIICWSKA